MNRSWQLVGLAGVIITLFGVLGGLLLGFAHFFALSHLILGGGLLTCYLLAGGLSVWISLLRGRKETSSSDRKREFWSWLGVFVLVCLLVVANVYVNHFDLRWDLTTEKRHSLSLSLIHI